jgi:hypothetical protein
VKEALRNLSAKKGLKSSIIYFASPHLEDGYRHLANDNGAEATGPYPTEVTASYIHIPLKDAATAHVAGRLSLREILPVDNGVELEIPKLRTRLDKQ